MHFEYVLQEVSKSFLYTINYTDDSGERLYALVTTSPDIAPEEVVSEVLGITELKEFVFWDLFTEKILRLPISEGDISFTFHNLHLLPGDDVAGLLHITDQQIIDEYNTEIINMHNKRRQAIIDIQAELSAEYNIVFTEEDIMCYIHLINTHLFAESEPGKHTYLIKLCMLLKSTPYKLLRGPVVGHDFNRAKDQWLLVIKSYVEKAKNQLNLEVASLDKEDDTYEIDLEEIEIIKNLLDEIPEEFIDELDCCITYKDLLEAWPPLLLPAPQFIIDTRTGLSVFTSLEKQIEWRLYDRSS